MIRLVMRARALIIFVVVVIPAVSVTGNFHRLYLVDSTIIRVPEDYPTIKTALMAASSGDIIIVSEGIYAEKYIGVFKSNLSLIANGTVVVDGLHEGNIFSISGRNVTIKGFTIVNSKLEHPYSGIQLLGTQNCVIEANNVTNSYYGIELAYSRDNTVVGNTVTNTHEPIELFHSEGNNITSNKIENNTFGIPLAYSNGNTITRNNISNNQLGAIALWHSNANGIVENHFSGGWYSVWVNASNYNNFTRNIVAWGNFGFWLWESQNNVLRHNNLTENKFNFGVWGANVQFFIHDIDASNIINGRPLYYLVNQSDMVVNASTFSNIGFLAVINSTNIIVENLSLTDNIAGVSFVNSVNSTVRYLNASNNFQGILLVDSQNISLVNNYVGNNEHGIRLFNSGGNFLRSNNMTRNHFDFGVEGETLPHLIQDIDVSNIVSGKPIYYWVNESAKHFPLDAGFVAAINCTDITVRDLNLTNKGQGVLFVYTTNSTIQNNNITNNWWSGIWLWLSNSNNISGNIITNSTWDAIRLQQSEKNSVHGNGIINNWRGMLLSQSNNNTIYHNNFTNNTQQVNSQDSINIWDNGYPVGGNYWGNKTLVDVKSGPYQDQLRSDGIGDMAYIIDAENRDRYSFMGPINVFDVGVWNGISREVHMISNSTVSNLQLNATEKTLGFNVTGETGLGFCRITIPNIIVQEMWPGNYTVLVDGEAPSETRNWTDSTNTYIYFTYQHPEHEVIIFPEFPLITILSLFIALSTAATISAKRKIPRQEDYEK